MGKISNEQIFLWAGAVSWIIYFLTAVVLASVTPGYSQIANIISELGRNEAPYHKIFNVLIMLSGFLALSSGLGFFYSVKRATGRNKLAIVIGILVAMFGTSIIFAGLFPLPDPRHLAYGMGNVQIIIPFFLFLAFWKTLDARPFALFHIWSFIIIILVFVSSAVVITGSHENVTPYIGLIQRIDILSFFIWYMFTYFWLLARKV